MAIKDSLPGYTGDITEAGLQSYYASQPGYDDIASRSQASYMYSQYQKEVDAAKAAAPKGHTATEAIQTNLQNAQKQYQDYVASQRANVASVQAYLNDPSNLEAERQMAVATAQRRIGQEYAARGLSQTTHMSNAMERLVYESQMKAYDTQLNRKLQSVQLGQSWANTEAQAAQLQMGSTEWLANYEANRVNTANQLALAQQQLALQQQAQEGSFWDTLTGLVGIAGGVAGAYSGIQQGSYYGAAANKIGSSSAGPTMAAGTFKF